MANAPEHVHSVAYDRGDDVLTFDGYKFHGELLRQFTETPCGRMFRVVERRDHVITVSQQEHPLASTAPELLAALKTAVGHIEHMAAFFSGKVDTGYSFESLGEDMPGIRAAISKAEGTR